MKNLLGTLSFLVFTSSVLSIQSAAMMGQENDFSTIVIPKFKTATKKWRSYVNVEIRPAGKFSPLLEQMLRENFSQTKTYFFNAVLIDDKSIIHHAMENLNLDSNCINFYNFQLVLKSQKQYIHAINYYSIPLGFYAIELYSDEQLVIDILQELLHYGILVNANYAQGERLLDAAVAHNRVQVVKYLLKKGAYPDAIFDSSEPAPLHVAYNEDNLEIVQILLEFGANPDVFDQEGYTLMHQASLNNQHQLARMLMLYKADPNSYDIFGQRPIDYASAHKNQAGKNGILFQMLLDFKPDNETPQIGYKRLG